MGSCCKVSIAQENVPHNRAKLTKGKSLGVDHDVSQAGFVDVLHKDGSTTQYMYNPSAIAPITGSETLNVHAETIDMKKVSVQVAANEKVSVLKQKICEMFGFGDALVVFQGKVLDLSEAVGNAVTQGCSVDVLAI